MFLVDYSFTYKYTLRNLLINKIISLNNTYTFPILNKVVIYVSFVDLDNLLDPQAYNYHYLFKFFFGRRSFISRFKEVSAFGSLTYKINIKLILNKNNVYPFLFFLVNDLLSKIDTSFLFYGVYSKSYNIFYMLLKDLSIFSDKKTNLGLFNLQQSMHFNFYVNGCSFDDCSVLLQSLKLRIF